MLLNGVSLIEINDRAVKSIGQDQTAHMCRLTLLYTLCKKCIVVNGRIRVSSLPNDKTLDWSNLKAFAYDKICDWKIETYSRKGRKCYGESRKCWLFEFSPFPIMF